MTIQLTIIGLGQIGSSIGLALAEHADKFTITGTDIDGKVSQESHKRGAVTKTTSNINQAVKDADVVILSLPLDQVLEMIEITAPIMKAGAILLETAPTKEEVAKRVKDCLPESCSYVGLTPVLNPNYIHNEGYGIDTAQADLFHNGMFGIITPPQSNAQAVNFAADFIQLLGASPLFIDLQENDGLMAATHLLPQLLSIAMLNSTIDHPGWGEARKVAGRAFAEVTGPAAHLDDAEALKSAVIFNQENVVRKIDDIIGILNEFRHEIANNEDEALTSRITQAKDGVNQWWLERGRGNWSTVENPETVSPHHHSGIIGNLFGFGLGRRKKRDEE